MYYNIKQFGVTFVFLFGIVWQVAAMQNIDNPYASINWESVEYVHSVSHQHGTDPQLFWDMGLRHLPLSNYYPSKPLYPLPKEFTDKHPGVIAGHNAEQHSCTDHYLHFNAIGSYYTTGHGDFVTYNIKNSPFEYTFKGLEVFDRNHEPWRGLYFLSIHLDNVTDLPGTGAQITIEGGLHAKRDADYSLIGNGIIYEMPLSSTNKKSICVLASAPEMKMRLTFDPENTKITRLRLMQGTNRPWRDAFKSALDGTLKNKLGEQIEGLVCPDGGGITINHPMYDTEKLLEFLSFDERVLGYEVYNHHFRFGANSRHPTRTFMYNHWDRVLKKGRRCWGFFVKDHCDYGTGRNILLLPANLESMSKQEQEYEAMRAYREGRFFGSVTAIATNAKGKVAMPYDFSGFSFKRITIRKDEHGKPIGLEVAVDGADQQKRPNTHIRFITEKGIVSMIEGKTACYLFPQTPEGRIDCSYVRVEAYAYPDTHQQGREPLNHAIISKMKVGEIVNLFDQTDYYSSTYVFPRRTMPEPIIITDMIFSQPIVIR